MTLHVFIIYDSLTDTSFSQNIYEKIIDKCEIYNSTRENIQKIFDKINTFPDDDFVWILYNNNSLIKEFKLPNNVDTVFFNNYCNGLIIDNERLKDFPIKDLNISQFILKSHFLYYQMTYLHSMLLVLYKYMNMCKIFLYLNLALNYYYSLKANCLVIIPYILYI